jgi:hypothetical protein
MQDPQELTTALFSVAYDPSDRSTDFDSEGKWPGVALAARENIASVAKHTPLILKTAVSL